MRLTLINLFYPPDLSPTAHLCAALAEHRAALGDEVTVLTSRAGYASIKPSRSDSHRVRVRRLWSTRFGSHTRMGRLIDWATFYIPALWASAKLPSQNVMISLTTPPFVGLAAWVHKLLHPECRFILWNMDVYPEALECSGLIRRGGVVSRLMRAMYRAMFKRLDHLICLDSAMARLLLSQHVPANSSVACSIIPNWESADLFPRDGIERAPRGNFNILYLGNAGFGHEIRTVLEAAELLRDEPVTFLFVGGGVLWPQIAHQRDAIKLTNITLRDYVPKSQTPAIMREADCALITLEDAMLGVMSPSKLHANLAVGLPIIYVGPALSNVGEAIRRFGCGISIRPGAARELVAGIRAMIRDKGHRNDLASRAREAFEAAYSDRQTLPLLDAVINRPPLKFAQRSLSRTFAEDECHVPDKPDRCGGRDDDPRNMGTADDADALV